MKDFIAATEPMLKKGVKKTEDTAVRFKHEGTDVCFFRPTTGQLGLMTSFMRGKMDNEKLSTMMQFFFGMMDEDTGLYFQKRIMDGSDPISDLMAENSMLDIMKGLSEEWSGKASEKSSASKPPRRATGGKSTGTTRVRASTS